MEEIIEEKSLSEVIEEIAQGQKELMKKLIEIEDRLGKEF